MQGLAPIWLDPTDQEYTFPDVTRALTEPDGLLAIGGSLCPARLESAYRRGIFPWYNDDQPLLWWSPDPRSILYPSQVHVSKSLQKTLRKGLFTVTFDQAFAEVISACKQPRSHEPGTWITSSMQEAYCEMFNLGHAHSVECWHDGALVGGLYGLSFGKVFFGESMFSLQRDASKVALVTLARQLRHWQYALIDCQVTSPHLSSLGAVEIPRAQFTELLERWCNVAGHKGIWQPNITPDNNQRQSNSTNHELP